MVLKGTDRFPGNPVPEFHQCILERDCCLGIHHVWGNIVQANRLMFEVGNDDCPGELVYSIDDSDRIEPLDLQDVANSLRALTGTKPADPESLVAKSRRNGRWTQLWANRTQDSLAYLHRTIDALCLVFWTASQGFSLKSRWGSLSQELAAAMDYLNELVLVELHRAASSVRVPAVRMPTRSRTGQSPELRTAGPGTWPPMLQTTRKLTPTDPSVRVR